MQRLFSDYDEYIDRNQKKNDWSIIGLRRWHRQRRPPRRLISNPEILSMRKKKARRIEHHLISLFDCFGGLFADELCNVLRSGGFILRITSRRSIRFVIQRIAGYIKSASDVNTTVSTLIADLLHTQRFLNASENGN